MRGKDRFEVRDKRYEGDAENFYKRGIYHIRMFSFVLTKWILLSTIWRARRSDGSDGQTGSLLGFLSD